MLCKTFLDSLRLEGWTFCIDLDRRRHLIEGRQNFLNWLAKTLLEDQGALAPPAFVVVCEQQASRREGGLVLANCPPVLSAVEVKIQLLQPGEVALTELAAVSPGSKQRLG